MLYNPCPAQSRLEPLNHYLTQILGPPSQFAHHCLKITVLKACSRDCSSWDICCGCCLVTQFVTPGTVARQAPLSMEFPRQGYRRRLPLPSPGDLLNPGIKPMCPASPCGFFTTELPGKPPPWDMFLCKFHLFWKSMQNVHSFVKISAILALGSTLELPP